MKRFLIFILFIKIIDTSAQLPYSFYAFYSIGQSQIVNPAAPIFERFTLGFVNTGVVVDNTAFKPMELFLRDGNINQVIKNSISGMQQSDYLNVDARTDLFYLGFKVGKLYFSAGSYNQKSMIFGYPVHLFQLAYFGNASFQNQTVNLLGNSMEVIDYSAIHFGTQFQWNKLSVGARIKALNGIQSFKSESTKAEVGFYDSTWTIETDILIRSSGLFSEFAQNNLNPGNHFMPGSTGNSGFALDFGASWKISEKMRLSLVAADLGRIRWNQNLTEYYSSGKVTFNGLNINLAEDNKIDSFEEVIDSINSALNVSERTGSEYTTMLPSRFTAVFDYTFYRRHRVTALVDYRMWNGYSMVALSGQYHMPLTRWLHVLGSYTITNQNFSNIGTGFMFKILGIQLFAVTDQINALYNPEKLNTINVRAGINVSLSNSEYYTKKKQIKPQQ